MHIRLPGCFTTCCFMECCYKVYTQCISKLKVLCVGLSRQRNLALEEIDYNLHNAVFITSEWAHFYERVRPLQLSPPHFYSSAEWTDKDWISPIECFLLGALTHQADNHPSGTSVSVWCLFGVSHTVIVFHNSFKAWVENVFEVPLLYRCRTYVLGCPSFGWPMI